MVLRRTAILLMFMEKLFNLAERPSEGPSKPLAMEVQAPTKPVSSEQGAVSRGQGAVSSEQGAVSCEQGTGGKALPPAQNWKTPAPSKTPGPVAVVPTSKPTADESELEPVQCARECSSTSPSRLPSKTLHLAADAIRILAGQLAMTPYRAIAGDPPGRAELAIAHGETVNAFWFEDSKWKGEMASPATIGMAKAEPLKRFLLRSNRSS